LKNPADNSGKLFHCLLDCCYSCSPFHAEESVYFCSRLDRRLRSDQVLFLRTMKGN